MLLKDQPQLRRLILIGTPLLTAILLLLHPLPDAADMPQMDHLSGMDVYNMMAPLADGFLAVHAVFALALGLAVILMLQGVRGLAATISRVCAFLFAITYIMYGDDHRHGDGAAGAWRGGAAGR